MKKIARRFGLQHIDTIGRFHASLCAELATGRMTVVRADVNALDEMVAVLEKLLRGIQSIHSYEGGVFILVS